jgi:hypothetical protein
MGMTALLPDDGAAGSSGLFCRQPDIAAFRERQRKPQRGRALRENRFSTLITSLQ